MFQIAYYSFIKFEFEKAKNLNHKKIGELK